MPRSIECDYCGDDIEPGTGTMYVRVNGHTVHFCSSKCEKNADLGREARDLEWTEAGRGTGRQTESETDREATVTETRAEDIEDQGQAVDTPTGPDVDLEEVEADEAVELDETEEDSEADKTTEETSEGSETGEDGEEEETEEAQA